MTFMMLESILLSRYTGFVFATLSGILFTLANSFFKMVKNLSNSEVVMIRGVVNLFFIIPFLLVLQNDIRGTPGTRVILWSGSAVKAIGIFLAFVAFRTLPYGEAIAILFCNPVIIMLLSRCFLKEPCGILKVFAVILLIVGLTFIAKPPEIIKFDSFENITDKYQHFENISAKERNIDNENFKNSPAKIEDKSLSELKAWPYGYIIAFCSTITLAIGIFAQKKVSGTTHYSVIIFSLATCYILAAFVGIFLESSPHGVPYNWTDVVFALVYGVTSLAAELLLILSLQILPASMVSMVRSLEIVLAFILQILWFQEPYHWSSFVGAAVVMLSVILITQEHAVTRAISNCWKEGSGSEKDVILNTVKYTN